MEKILLERAERQNWETYIVLYANGHSAIENRQIRTKKTTRVFLNIESTNKLKARFINEPKWNISGHNRITRFLIALGIVQINIKRIENE